MKAPEARLKLSGETSRKKPVMGLRPIKERNQRSEALIEEQVFLFQESYRFSLTGRFQNTSELIYTLPSSL